MKQLLFGAIVILQSVTFSHAADFESYWDKCPDRIWVGAEYWSNPMESWKISEGKLVCVSGVANTNVHLLTREYSEGPGDFSISLNFEVTKATNKGGNVGIKLVSNSNVSGYRSRVFQHNAGQHAYYDSSGALVIGKKRVKCPAGLESGKLTLFGDEKKWTLTLSDEKGDKTLSQVSSTVTDSEANIALFCNHAVQTKGAQAPRRGPASGFNTYQFSDWKISGKKITAKEERSFGPILWTMHTLSKGTLKLTAVVPPIGKSESQTVSLSVKEGGAWKEISKAKIDPISYTATFRVKEWDSSKSVEYRTTYKTTSGEGDKDHYYDGTIRAEPKDRPVVIAGFTGNQDYIFPNNKLVKNITIQDPDVLFFSGDQIYESVGGFGIVTKGPIELQVINFLRKQYMFGWAFGDLMRDRPTICLPDDHDVFMGNIWGEGGPGYRMSTPFVNAVHRINCGHHPDFSDTQPLADGKTIFHGDMLYGGVSFAILADRMFKTGPEKVADWKGRPDHQKDPNYDMSKVNKPGLKLMGDRQLKFMNEWAHDWEGAYAKVALSATIFCNLANYHGGGQQFIYADLDSNGWPQKGRDLAVEALRKGYAFHYAGDQHLSSIVHHGVNGVHRNAGYSFCVPSIAAGYPRSWQPDMEGRPVSNRPVGGVPNTGDYLDAFGNPMTVLAIGNPLTKGGATPEQLAHNKSSGHGIVRIDPVNQTVTMECYKLLFDATNVQPNDQFEGWPLTVDLSDNGGTKNVAYLPTLKIPAGKAPVVQVIDESSKEIVNSYRARTKTFQPRVYANGTYTIRVKDPESGKQEEFKGINANLGQSTDKQIELKLK